MMYYQTAASIAVASLFRCIMIIALLLRAIWMKRAHRTGSICLHLLPWHSEQLLLALAWAWKNINMAL